MFLQKVKLPELFTFILSGGFAALVNIGLRYVLSPFVGYSISIVIAFICAMTVGWALARYFVFSSSHSSPLQEYTKFAFVNLLALVQVWGISIILNDYIFLAIQFTYHPETVAHIIGVISPVLPSYFSHKYFTFQRKNMKFLIKFKRSQ